MRGAFPFVGHLPALAADGLGFIRLAEREKGKLFWMDGGFGVGVLNCLDTESFGLFKNKVTTSQYMGKDFMAPLFGGSMIAQDGELHRHMRTAMNAPFSMRGLADAKVGTTIAAIVQRRVRSWVGREIRILAETRELTLEVMFRILGVQDEDLSEWRRRYEDLMMLAINLPVDFPRSPRRRGLDARHWLDRRIEAIVLAARAAPPQATLISSLAHARDDDGKLLAIAELVDNLRLVLLAGHETSASTMAWVASMVAMRPDVWERLKAESMAAGDLPRSHQEAKSFPFAEALFRECLRLYPPVSADARCTLKEIELLGRKIPEGVYVGIPIAYLSRSPALFDRPDELVPDRWLGRDQGPSPLELVQFGGGPHFCLGYHLAWLEIVAFAAALGLGLRGRPPRVVGRPPRPVYVPLLHPSAGTRLAFD